MTSDILLKAVLVAVAIPVTLPPPVTVELVVLLISDKSSELVDIEE